MKKIGPGALVSQELSCLLYILASPTKRKNIQNHNVQNQLNPLLNLV